MFNDHAVFMPNRTIFQNPPFQLEFAILLLQCAWPGNLVGKKTDMHAMSERWSLSKIPVFVEKTVLVQRSIFVLKFVRGLPTTN